MIIAAICSVQPVFAHGTEPRLEVNVDRVSLGAPLELRGVNFDYEEVVSLALIGSGVEILLAEITANMEGEFTYSVTIPVDLVEETYYIRGTTTHHWVLSPPLTILGAPVLEGENRGREEHGGLPVPIPTYAPGVVPGVVSTSAPIAASLPVESPPASLDLDTNILMLAGSIMLVILVLLALSKKRLV